VEFWREDPPKASSGPLRNLVRRTVIAYAVLDSSVPVAMCTALDLSIKTNPHGAPGYYKQKTCSLQPLQGLLLFSVVWLEVKSLYLWYHNTTLTITQHTHPPAQMTTFSRNNNNNPRRPHCAASRRLYMVCRAASLLLLVYSTIVRFIGVDLLSSLATARSSTEWSSTAVVAAPTLPSSSSSSLLPVRTDNRTTSKSSSSSLREEQLQQPALTNNNSNSTRPCRPVVFWSGGKSGSTSLAILLQHGTGIIGKIEAENNPGGNWKQGDTGQFVASPKEICWARGGGRGSARKNWETAMRGPCNDHVQFALDGCPAYGEENQAQMILAQHPDAKFLMLVRNPIDRILSLLNEKGVEIWEDLSQRH
jgi:hypothetical protein